MVKMSLVTAVREQDIRPRWPRALERRTDTRARALLGQLARFILALVLASGTLTLLVALKSAAYMSHHPI